MICIYEANETDWHGNGLCILQPSSCTVTEIAGGDFSLTLIHPITEDLRWKELQEERIIKAPVPAYRPLEDDGTVIECEHCHGHLQASLKHYVDGTTEVGWVDVEHTMRAKDTPRPVVFRDSALRKQIASVLGWETFDAGRMFETLSGISVYVDMVTLHFKDGSINTFRYIQPKQIHRKRKETT